MALCITDVSKTFGTNKNKINALNKVSLSIQSSEIYGLLGCNGAGKTTLIKCICGLLIPDSGSIMLDDVNLLKNNQERSKRISLLLDGGRSLYLNLSVYENIRYFSMIKGSPVKIKDDRTQKVFEFLHIEPLLKKVVAGLSYGMRQRVAIAVALICNSEIIILDEPTKGLDIKFQDELLNLLLSLKKEYQNTIVVSSHDMGFIRNVCDNCILLDKGVVVKEGAITDFINPFSIHTYTVRFTDELSDEKLDRLKDHLSISGVTPDRRGLDIQWDCRRDLYEMFALFQSHQIAVMEIVKQDDLMSSVLSIAKERVG